MRYLGNDINVLSLEAMKNMFEIAATNLKMAREKGDPKDNTLPSKWQPGDTVLVQNHTKGPFNPRYVGDYCVVSLKGNQVEVQPSTGGPMEMKHIKHVKYILPADQYIKQILYYSAFGRKATLRMNPDKTNIGQTRPQATDISTLCIDVDTVSYVGGARYGDWCGTTLNTDTITLQSNVKPVVCPTTHNNEYKI